MSKIYVLKKNNVPKIILIVLSIDIINKWKVNKTKNHQELRFITTVGSSVRIVVVTSQLMILTFCAI